MKNFGTIFAESFLLCIICFSLLVFIFSVDGIFVLPLFPAIISAFFITAFYVLKTKIDALEKRMAQLIALLEKNDEDN